MRYVQVVALLAVAPACVITSRNVNIGQVNRPSVPFTTSAPTSGVAALTAGASSMPTVIKPRSTSEISGAEVPDTQGRAELILRPKRGLFFGAVYERGFGHQAVESGLPTTRSGNVRGFGMILGGTLSDDPSAGFSLGVNATLMTWSVPYDQFSSVTFDAGWISGVTQYRSSNRDSAATIGLGLWPTYTLGQLRVFGGGYVTQRPTVNLITTDTTVITSTDIHSDQEDVIGNDAVDLVLAAGIEYSVTPELALNAIINQEVIGSIMRTGPSLQLAASIRFGKHPADRRRTDAPTTTPPSYAPPYAPPPYAPPPYAPPGDAPPPAPLPQGGT